MRFSQPIKDTEDVAKFPGLGPDLYDINVVITGDGYYVKSMRYARQEMASSEIDLSQGVAGEVEIAVASGAGSVDGSVQESTAGMLAILVPQTVRPGDPVVRSVQVDQNGRFSMTNLPPGHYFAFAVAGFDEDLWMNRDFTAQLRSKGAEVDVPEKGSAQVQVPVIPPDAVQRAEDAVK
jgi:hypothetical protein